MTIQHSNNRSTNLPDREFVSIMGLLMASDPFPLPQSDYVIITNLLNIEAQKRGFEDWYHAYHDFNPKEDKR